MLSAFFVEQNWIPLSMLSIRLALFGWKCNDVANPCIRDNSLACLLMLKERDSFCNKDIDSKEVF